MRGWGGQQARQADSASSQGHPGSARSLAGWAYTAREPLPTRPREPQGAYPWQLAQPMRANIQGQGGRHTRDAGRTRPLPEGLSPQGAGTRSLGWGGGRVATWGYGHCNPNPGPNPKP